MVVLERAGLFGVLLRPALQLTLLDSRLKLGHLAIDFAVLLGIQAFVLELCLVVLDLLQTLLEVITVFKGLPTTLIRLLGLRFLFGWGRGNAGS